MTGGSERRIFYQRQMISECCFTMTCTYVHMHTSYAYSECPFAHTYTHSTRLLWAQPQECSLTIRKTGHISHNGKIETHVSVKYNLNHMLLPYFCLVHQNCLSHLSFQVFFFLLTCRKLSFSKGKHTEIAKDSRLLLEGIRCV